MSEPAPHTRDYARRDARNTRAFLLWVVLATLAYLGAALAVRHRAALPLPLPWLAIAAAALLSGLAVQRYVLYLREVDELKRRIETEALAVGFGAGTVLSLLAPLVQRLGLPWLDASVVAAVMMGVWAVASFLGNRRYCGPEA